ncbi:MAG: YhbY family RNA-binding protein [Burkholderiales bacterium]
MKALTPAERQHLKGEAHQINPVVLIGSDGLTPAVLKEIDLSLKAHELLKIKAASGEREDRERWLAQICSDLAAQAVQHIGKTLVIYRENPAKKLPAPKAEPKKAAKPKRAKAKAKVPGKPTGKPAARRRSPKS